MANYPLGIIMHISKQSKFVAAGFSAAVALLVACGSGSTIDSGSNPDEYIDAVLAPEQKLNDVAKDSIAMQKWIEECKGEPKCIEAVVSPTSSSSGDGTSSATTASSSSAGTSSATTGSSSSAGTSSAATGSSSSAGTTTSSSSKTGSSSSKASSSSVAKALSATCAVSHTADVEFDTEVTWTVKASNGTPTPSYTYQWQDQSSTTTFKKKITELALFTPTVTVTDGAGGSVAAKCGGAKVKPISGTCSTTLKSVDAGTPVSWDAAITGGLGLVADTKYYWNGSTTDLGKSYTSTINANYRPTLRVVRGASDTTITCDSVSIKVVYQNGQTVALGSSGAEYSIAANATVSFTLASTSSKIFQVERVVGTVNMKELVEISTDDGTTWVKTDADWGGQISALTYGNTITVKIKNLKSETSSFKISYW